MVYNKNKVKLYIDTDLSDSDEFASGNNSNKFRFKTYVNGIIEIQNLQDFILRLSIVTSLFILTCPCFIMNYYFLHPNTNTNANANANANTNANANANANIISNIYLKISIIEQLLLSAVAYYYIITKDLNNKNTKSSLIMCGKIEEFWAKYYSGLGITISTAYYYSNGYINSSYMYILCFSIFRLWVIRFLLNKKNNLTSW